MVNSRFKSGQRSKMDPLTTLPLLELVSCSCLPKDILLAVATVTTVAEEAASLRGL